MIKIISKRKETCGLKYLKGQLSRNMINESENEENFKVGSLVQKWQHNPL